MFNELHCEVVVTNCSFSGNRSGNGAALACDSQGHPSELEVANSILADGGGEIWNDDGSVISIRYSDVEGGWEGEGNIDVDPCFVEAGYWDVNGTPEEGDDDFWVDGDYRLWEGSPCIDAGDPNYAAGSNETDLDGGPRVLSDRIDMGAYEFGWVVMEMKLTPHMLDCESGNWVKAHFVLPEGFLLEDIDASVAAVAEPPGVESEYVNVLYKGAGRYRIEVAFDLTGFCDALPVTEDGFLEVTVAGSLTSGQCFYGTDTIKLIGEHWRHRHRNQNEAIEGEQEDYEVPRRDRS